MVWFEIDEDDRHQNLMTKATIAELIQYGYALGECGSRAAVRTLFFHQEV